MKPMIFFDVDGTLRDNHHHQVCPSTIEALNKLHEYGYKIGVATGRSVNSLKRTGIPDLIKWDGYVCNNGQSILDQDYNLIQELIIDPKVVRQCIETAKKHNIPLALKTENRFLTQDPEENVLTAIKYFNSQVPPVGTYHDEKVAAMIAYGPLGYNYVPFKAISGIHVLPGVSTYCDITHADATKATGIKYLLNKYQLEEYVCFGDSLNDVEMFKHAKISICMGQGDEYLKSIATYVTDSIDDDGLYNACKQYQFI